MERFARDFFLDLYTTALAPDEIVSEILCPLPPPRTGGAHLKLERRSGDYAIANCSVLVTLDPVGRYQNIGIGIGGVSTMAIKVTSAEDLLRGELPGEALHLQAARLVSTCTNILSDIRGSAEYRRKVLHVLFLRALAIAQRRAHGELVEVQHV
jgi:carbon-monoxide dehydrogenase medium subunit